MIKINHLPILRITISALIFLSFGVLRSQQEQHEASYLNWFDQQVGVENTSLYDGIIYRETYRTVNDKIKFYKSPLWLKGAVLYSGQLFSDIPMRYDIFGDQLLIKQEDRLGGGAILLFKEKVATFTIDEATFVNVKEVPEGTARAGFYELLWENDQMRLLAKHQKNDFLKKDRSSIYYEFVDEKKQYLIQYNGTYSSLKSKKDVIAVFPDLKKQIDNFYKDQKRLRNRDMDAFMQVLVNYIEDQFIQNQSEIQP